MSAVDPRRIETASLSHVGRVREHNEDACDEFEDASGRRLLVVADGMGGHRGGATASRLAVEVIGEVFQNADQDPETTLRLAFDTANQRIFRMSLDNPELRGMGTTAVAVLFDGAAGAWTGHVGDSRVYRLRGNRIAALTQDHSVVGEMLRQGLLTAAQAEVHPRRHEILRSLGVEPAVRPDVVRADVEAGDRFLLCSDGLTGLATEQEIAEVIRREPPDRAAQVLIEIANGRGGPDNVTVQIAACPAAEARRSSSADSPDRGRPDRVRRTCMRPRVVAAALGTAILALGAIWLIARL